MNEKKKKKKKKQDELKYIIKKINNLGGYVMLCNVTLTKQSWKCNRSSAAGTVLSFDVAVLTAFVMIDSA
jgi:hypothetical protein